MNENMRMMAVEDLGDLITERTGDPEGAAVRLSSAPQWRYDWLVWRMVGDPAKRACFSTEELWELTGRIEHGGMRYGAGGQLWKIAEVSEVSK